MHSRATALTKWGLPAALSALLLLAGEAHAHRLDAQAFLLPGHKIQIESWFSNGIAARGAKVEVFRSGGQIVMQGNLDHQGVFIFSYDGEEPIKIAISAGAGHYKELLIAAEDLVRAGASSATLQNSVTQPPLPSSPGPLSDRQAQAPWKDILAGIGFLLALAAFVLSWRNFRQLQQIRQIMNGRNVAV